jgi:phospholipase/carboxylesterase
MLHGTGGNELDLLPLAGRIDDEASVLSVRGNVLENGMPRFFRRLAEGVFDEKDLIFRTKELTLLERANAEVTLHWENRGHQLTVTEVEAAAQWYKKLYSKK